MLSLRALLATMKATALPVESLAIGAAYVPQSSAACNSKHKDVIEDFLMAESIMLGLPGALVTALATIELCLPQSPIVKCPSDGESPPTTIAGVAQVYVQGGAGTGHKGSV